MQLLLEIPKLELDTVRIFLMKNNFVHGAVQRKRKDEKSPPSPAFENIIVNDIFISKGNAKQNRDQTLFASVTEVIRSRRKINKQNHSIELNFHGENVESVVCKKCDEAKVSCNAILSFMYWIQHKQDETLCGQENVAPEKSQRKKPQKKEECYVLIDKIPIPNSVPTFPVARVLRKLKKEPISITPLEENDPKKFKMMKECYVVIDTVPIPSPAPTTPVAPVLRKLKKEPVPITTLELEDAQKLSMFALVREYKGNSPEEFLQFCSKRMAQQSCCSIELLTVEQADTDLWHELRKGRITASRMYEASRCTMLNGSLTNKIMGISSGFSFAMKRGTDLEGHVFAELQKEYPGLRNTGLVLDPRFPWMGASPDGICDEFVLEIKCPYTQKTYDCYLDVKKLSKKYFAQIQLQMHMTHKTKALLGVAALDFETTKKVTKVWIDYDKAYVDQIKAESYEFWCKAVFKALLKKRNNKT